MKMQSRRIVITAAVLGALWAGPPAVQAASMNEYDELQTAFGLFESSGSFSAVGLTSKVAGTVYWRYFDPNGNGLVSGNFSVEANRLTPFIWDATTAGGTALADVPGVLLFGLDTDGNARIEPADGNNLVANAFLVDLAAQDVAYSPTVDIDAADISEPDPSKWTNLPILNFDSAKGKVADTGDVVDVQYLIDGAAGGDDTLIYLWISKPVASTQAMTIYDGAGASKPISVPFLFNSLNLIDLEQLPDVTSDFYGDGFIRWTVPSSTTATSIDVFAGAVVVSPTFGAMQTLMGSFTD